MVAVAPGLIHRRWKVSRRHREVADRSETGSAAGAPQKSREILPQGLDGNVRLRGGTPTHALVPSGLPEARASVRPRRTPFSAVCSPVRCPSRTGQEVLSGNHGYINSMKTATRDAPPGPPRSCSGRSTGSGGAGPSPGSRRARRRAQQQRPRRRPWRWTIRRRIPLRSQRRVPPTPNRRWCSMRQEGRSSSRRRPARALAKSAGCWPTWPRSWRCWPTGCARSATAAMS